MDYKLLWDLHTHTTYSHGTGTIADNVRAAAERGLLAVGIADHGPGHSLYGVKRDAFPEMRREVERLRDKYPELTILLGCEANIINRSGTLDASEEDDLDYLAAGYHFGAFGEEPIRAAGLCLIDRILPDDANAADRSERWKRIRKANTDRMLAALYHNRIRILSHPGAKAPVDLRAVADACRERETLLEINGKHGHLTAEELRLVKDSGALFCIGSDAHSPEAVGRFEEQLARALDAGLSPERIVNIAPKNANITKGDLPTWMQLS